MKKLLLPTIMLLFVVVFFVYKMTFIRDVDGQHRGFAHVVGDHINRLPYAEYFYIQQEKPSTFFTTPAFPSYTEWCHDNKKLCAVLPLQQMYADMQWIGSIQFVGSQEKPNKALGLSKLLDNLSNLAPYWDYPYAFGQLLIPIAKKQASSEDPITINQSREDAKKLSSRAETYLCDQTKIAEISALDEKSFIDTVYNTDSKQKLANPCPSYERPHYAAFNAFYFRRDAAESARNYKISSFNDGSPGLAPIMAALVYGRGGEHLKSASIRYDKYISLSEKVDAGYEADEILLREKDESLKKAVFELQLQLITDADNATNKSCNKSFACLQDNGHIKKAIQDSYNTICEKGTNDGNLRCVLLNIGLTNKWITLQGTMQYPVQPDRGFVFAWNDTYDSWWIQGPKDESASEIEENNQESQG